MRKITLVTVLMISFVMLMSSAQAWNHWKIPGMSQLYEADGYPAAPILVSQDGTELLISSFFFTEIVSYYIPLLETPNGLVIPVTQDSYGVYIDLYETDEQPTYPDTKLVIPVTIDDNAILHIKLEQLKNVNKGKAHENTNTKTISNPNGLALGWDLLLLPGIQYLDTTGLLVPFRDNPVDSGFVIPLLQQPKGWSVGNGNHPQMEDNWDLDPLVQFRLEHQLIRS